MVDASIVIVNANILLSQGEFSDALDAYTNVIYHVYSGHPCALLNRALAYLALGYPELAAADAYRVAQICTCMRKVLRMTIVKDTNALDRTGAKASGADRSSEGSDPRINTRRYQLRESKGREDEEFRRLVIATERYLLVDKTCTQQRDRWTLEENRYISAKGKWCNQELASIVLCGLRAQDVGRSRINNPLDRSVADDLEVRAMYRLCGALWECGQGAVMDSLGLIEDVENLEAGLEKLSRSENLVTDAWALTNNDLSQFQAMGGAIVKECVERHQWNSDRNEAYSRSKVTMVNRVVYPWNKLHPNLNDLKVAEDAADFLTTVGPCLALHQVKETKTSPYSLHLVASQPFCSGDMVLKEYTLLHASHSDTYKSESCEACGAVILTVSRGGQDSATSITSDSTEAPSSKAGQSTKSEISEAGNQYDGKPMAFRLQGPTLERDIVDEPCDECDIIYCTPECSRRHTTLHILLCSGDLNERLDERCAVYKRALSGAEKHLSPGFFQAEATYLHHKLLAKVLALAHSRNAHPLEIDEVRWLNGKLYAAPENAVDARTKPGKGITSDHIALPWSFDNNIVIPAQMTEQLGLNPWEEIEKVDGWVMNTLMAKIETSADITKGRAQYIKALDDNFKCYPREAQNYHKSFPDLWTATIHPVASLAVKASPEKHANVTWTRDTALVCYSLCDQVSQMDCDKNQSGLANTIVRPDISDAVGLGDLRGIDKTQTSIGGNKHFMFSLDGVNEAEPSPSFQKCHDWLFRGSSNFNDEARDDIIHAHRRAQFNEDLGKIGNCIVN